MLSSNISVLQILSEAEEEEQAARKISVKRRSLFENRAGDLAGRVSSVAEVKLSVK